MTAGDLPEELMIDILTRLPVKTLVRFECIHKSWKSLIKSSDFVITHSQNPKNRTHGSIFVAYYDHDSGNVFSSLFFRSIAPNSFDVRADLVIPSIIKQRYTIRSSCNGLVCLCNYDPCSIVLYNPCLNQCKILPTSNLYHNQVMSLSELFGFGYDSTNNDYKVVRELRTWDYVPRRITQVYSLRSNSWRKLGSNIIPDDIRLCGGIGFGSDCLFNGAIHRLAYYPRNNHAGKIVSFDVCNEEFHMFSRPNLKGCDDNLKISVSGDLLSIFDLVRHVERVCCDIWVMKEYGVEDSWILLHSIKLFCPRPYNGFSFLGLGMNGEFILDKGLKQGHHELLVYNKHEILIKTIKVEHLSYCAFGCIESLVSLDQRQPMIHPESKLPRDSSLPRPKATNDTSRIQITFGLMIVTFYILWIVGRVVDRPKYDEAIKTIVLAASDKALYPVPLCSKGGAS
ncbi:hypothetical protein COLO4_23770 [Corchorus olitorius]|uniref:F-box domain-containing protein n=1 Tax=Corchorus olitorius TaxID=93759 RepID=A0A1R3IES4_9ROSI|nr:hypothetical protein COLO4_23770 [Corchorus olitorius]